MLVKLENPQILAKAIEIISELVTEVRIKIGEFGMSISAMDPANVAMVGFKLPRTGFTQFEVGDGGILGVNLDNLKQVLKRCGTGSSLILEKKDNFLNFTIEDRVRRNFSLNLIEIESEDIDFDTKTGRMEFSSQVEVNSIDLISSIEDCTIVADACSFIISDGKFIIEAKSLNSTRSEFSGDEAQIQAENCKSKYSLEYISKFMKAAKLCDKIKLRFANDHPLRIDFKTAHLELDFILAPRVETGD